MLLYEPTSELRWNNETLEQKVAVTATDADGNLVIDTVWQAVPRVDMRSEKEKYLLRIHESSREQDARLKELMSEITSLSKMNQKTTLALKEASELLGYVELYHPTELTKVRRLVGDLEHGDDE